MVFTAANDKGYVEGYRTGFKTARDLLALDYIEDIGWEPSGRHYADEFRQGVTDGFNDGVLFNDSIGV